MEGTLRETTNTRSNNNNNTQVTFKNDLGTGYVSNLYSIYASSHNASALLSRSPLGTPFVRQSFHGNPGRSMHDRVYACLFLHYSVLSR